MKAIDFVVRDGAGGLQRGVVSADAKTQTIQAQTGQEISLNLRQTDLQGQVRSGDDLLITLSDGRLITIDNYFNSTGPGNRLFISTDGYLNEVAFVDQGAGDLHAQYGPTEQWGKWSPSDDLIYLGRTDVAAVVADDEVSMFGAPLLGAGLLGGGGTAAAVAGVGGLVAIGGIGDGGGDGAGAGPAAPFVNEPENSTDIGGDGSGPHVITVTGGGVPGEAVTVTIGDETIETVIDEDGTFVAVFEGDDFPVDGVYESVVTVATGGGDVVLDGPGYHIDTTPPEVAITEGSESVGDFFNSVTFSDGVTLTGTGEAGASVVLTIEGVSRTTTVTEAGTWTATWETGVLEPGEYTTGVTIVSTDAFGNSTTVTDNVVVDTIATVAINADTVETDGTITASERDDGVTITGSAQAGSSVVVTFGSGSHTVTADASGNWSADFIAAEVSTGELVATVTAVATDTHGNTATTTGDVNIDTIANVTVDTDSVETDGIVNAVERGDGVTLTGTTQPGSSVTVTFGSGAHEATVDANGNWSADFTMAEVPTGELGATVTAVATDALGNQSTASGEVDIDTLVRDFGYTGTTGGADGVINIVEAQSGFTMTGTTEPGSTVDVTMNGFTHTATVAANGTWTVGFAASEIPTGEQTVVMSATATDGAGNVDTITRDVIVDRDAGILTISSTPVEGDDIVNEVEASDGVTLTGTTNAGASVVVTMAGVSHTVVADGAGNWTANFAANEVTPGVYTADITATTVDPAGNPLEATDSVQVDTRVDNLSIDTGAVGGGDGIINAAERLEGGGMRITGTTEVGSTSVVVTLNGVDVNASVDAAGNWTAVYAANQVEVGTYNASATVTATDRAGNVDSATGTIRVDTEVVPFSIADGAGGADGVANAAEVATGIDLGGQVEAGSTVVVNFDGTDHAANVDAAGNWSLTIPPSAIRAGTYAAAIEVTATDAVGNSDVLSDTLAIDTDAPDGPVIASYTRDGDGIRGISTEISADDLDVYQVNNNGSVSDVNTTQTDIDVLGESNFAFSPNVPDGSHLVITATDDAGNINGTYVVLDDEASATEVSLNAGTLGSYNIETLDLNFAEEGNLTIDETTLLALSSNSNELQINGGADDTVNIAGAVRGGSAVRDGQTYDIYTLGNEGTLYIDDNVTVVI